MRKIPLGALAMTLLVGGIALTFHTARADGDGEVLDDAAMRTMLQTIDDRQRNNGDFKALTYIETKERGKEDVVYEAVIYRRDGDDKLMILFLRPKSEQGKGYLRIDRNLWMYDPTVGKWERRTERERIAGSDSRRADFDESRLAEEFDPSFAGAEKLGRFVAWKLILKAKEGQDVAYPVVHLWVDQKTGNVLKRQDFALSGRLMRTAYYPKWKKIYSESKKADVWFPKEMRFFDEVEKENRTTVLIKSVDLRPLDHNMFTKAWLESKSR